MLGGPEARADAATLDARFAAIRRISSPSRPDLAEQMSRMLAQIKLSATEHAATSDADVSGKSVVAEEDSELAFMPGDRGRAGAHVALWRECARGDKPLLIMEDGLILVPKFGEISAHAAAVVERLCEPSKNAVILYLGGTIDPAQLTPQWLPTNLQQPNGEAVVLREAESVHETCAYVLWPLAAQRLLSSLPLRGPAVDHFISLHLLQQNLRALVVTPFMAAKRTDVYTPPKPVTRYRVVHSPRVAVRNAPQPNGFIEGARSHGDILVVTELSADGNWARIGDKEWVMIRHEKLGLLLEKLPNEEEQEDNF